MARQDLKPIEHNKFIGAVDSEYTDAQDLPITALAKTTNLTQFRKIGALVQAPGTSLKVFNGTSLSHANLPDVTDFSPIQFESFSVDRDEKEVILMVFKHNSTSETKMFIQPYWNPSSYYENCRLDKLPNSWIYEWVELTEKITFTMGSVDEGNANFQVSGMTKSTGYYNGFFAINNNLINSASESQLFVKLYEKNDLDEGTFTLLSTPTNWLANHTVTLYRFPVTHWYKTDLPTPVYPSYSNSGNPFDAVPTQFLKSLNEVRIGCGKNNRPLIISMLKEKKFFAGKLATSWDGFWFGFQQIPQVLYRSYVSYLADTTVATADNIIYWTPLIDLFGGSTSHWNSVDIANDRIKFIWTGEVPVTLIWENKSLTLNTKQKAIDAGYTPFGEFTQSGVVKCRMGFKQIGQKYYFCLLNAPPGSPTKTQHFYDYLYIYFSLDSHSYWNITKNSPLIPDDIEGTVGVITSHTLKEGSMTIVSEAGGNTQSKNLFIGVIGQVVKKSITNGHISLPFIMTIVYDNRNEIVVSQGRMYVNPEITGGNNYPDAFQLKFNAWFDRRITHIKYYSGTPYTIAGGIAPNAYVLEQANYPYFGWSKEVKINELPLNRTMKVENITKGTNGELAIDKYARNVDIGQNTFGFDLVNGYWFIKYGKDVSGFSVEEKGKDLKFLVSTNRWIDQDITMNYTRMCFVGQTNGRYFITNCKNTVEGELFENDDLVIYSNFCVGISAYDIYTRDKNLLIAAGDKDINVDLLSYKGYIMLIKQTNNYLINVKTGNELQYTIVDTMTGRGASDYNSVCPTPYGVVICSKDSIYLLNSNSITPLLTETNGRLKLYLDKFVGKKLQCQYYNDKNELIIISTDVLSRTGDIATVLVYNFRYKFWTTYEYATSTNPIWTTIDHDKNILMLNYKDDDNFNVVKMDETSSTFMNPYGTVIDMHWEIETHSVPYSNNLVDLELDWIDFIVNYTNSADRTLKINMKFDDDINDITDYITLASSSSLEKKNHLKSLLINPTLSRTLTLNVKNLSSNSVVQKFAYFSLNSFIYWINSLQRKRQTN